MKALSGGWNEDMTYRKGANDLHDYVCDWEHDVLNEAKHHCRKFDKIDVLHWRGYESSALGPLFTHAITLVYMAVTCDTPILGCGSGAFAGIYCAATQGARFNILNGPLGDDITTLPTFPHYSVGNSAYLLVGMIISQEMCTIMIIVRSHPSAISGCHGGQCAISAYIDCRPVASHPR